MISKINAVCDELKRRKVSSLNFKHKEKERLGNYYSTSAFDYYKCIYVHIPKTAGVAVAKSLFGNLAAGHKNFRYYQSKYPKYTLQQYFKFTIVRHPYTRINSAFHFLQAGGINQYDESFKTTVIDGYEDVNDFILHYLNEDTIYAYTHFIPQVDFLKNNRGKIDMDFIGRFEQIADDYSTIAQKLKIKTLLTYHNKTKTNQKNSLNTQAKKKICELYHSDFKLLGYQP